MKIVAFIAAFILMGSTACQAVANDNEALLKVIDLEKMKSDRFADFIRYAFWPESEMIAARKSDGRLIEKDLKGLPSTLDRILNMEVLPAGDDLSSAFGISSYSDEGDFLFVRYSTKSGVLVQVQDGKALYILMSSTNWNKGELSDIGRYVKNIALKVIRFPSEGGIDENPIIFVSSLNVGQSRCGTLSWKHRGEGDNSFTDFYSHMFWWSDGTRILFAMSKMTPDDYRKLATMANRQSLRTPRKFQKPIDP